MPRTALELASGFSICLKVRLATSLIFSSSGQAPRPPDVGSIVSQTGSTSSDFVTEESVVPDCAPSHSASTIWSGNTAENKRSHSKSAPRTLRPALLLELHTRQLSAEVRPKGKQIQNGVIPAGGRMPSSLQHRMEPATQSESPAPSQAQGGAPSSVTAH